jgi:gentisate 1,2-dioxygenase
MLEKLSGVAHPTPSTSDAQYFEYTQAANPIGAGLIPKIPCRTFSASLYDSGATRIIPLDLSEALGCEGPATGPGLLAHFLRILAGERLSLNPNASSQVFYVLDGSGTLAQAQTEFSYAAGDFFALPGGAEAIWRADTTSRLYYVNDAPLLTYLGASVSSARFAPTRYPAEQSKQELQKAAQDGNANKRNRISVLFGNARFPQTRTVTHSMWAMYGLVPPHSMQKAHRHQSIALDFVSDCQPGCYSLVGTHLDEQGNIAHPQRVDWSPGMVFVTPPGHWHSHHNESDADAYVIPFQDAGLHTYLRTLDIQFSS